jgi:hypothetical protein
MSKGRSTLKSFSFGSYKGVDELPDVVVGLFSSMMERPEKSVEYAEEIINAALEGRINFDKEFNMGAYENSIRNNTRMNAQDRMKKETFFTDDDLDEAYKGGVSENKVSDDRDDYASFEDEDEVKWAVNSIKAENNTYRIDYGINLIKLLKGAVKGFPHAIERLKEVCNEFKQVNEWVQVILKSGHTVESLFTDDNVVSLSAVSEVREAYVVAEKENREEVVEVKSNNAVVVDIRDMFRKEMVSKPVEETEVIELVAEEEKEIIREVAELKDHDAKVVDIRDMFKQSSNTESTGVSAIGECLTVEDVLEKEAVADAVGVLSENDDKLIAYFEDDSILAVNNFQANLSTNRFIYSINMSELLQRSDSRYPQSSEKLRDVGDKYVPELRGAENSHPIVLFYPDKDKVVDLAEARSKKANKNSLLSYHGVSPSNRCRAVSNKAIPMCLGKEIQTYSATG